MKSYSGILLSFSLLLLPMLPAQAGIWDIIQDTVEDNASEQTRKIFNDSVDEIVNGEQEQQDEPQSSDTVSAKSQSTSPQNSGSTSTKKSSKAQTAAPNIKWDRYDFIPGDEIIFADGPSPDEENGEFPSRWDRIKGNSEIVEFDGQNVIALVHDQSTIIPYLKHNSQDYLPEVFTIEFDIYFQPKVAMERIFLYLKDLKNQPHDKNLDINGYTPYIDSDPDGFELFVNGVIYLDQKNRLPDTKSIDENSRTGWRHIAIAYNKGKLKVYMDATRLINIPHAQTKPSGLTLSLQSWHSTNYDKQLAYIKNVRIAKGGVKYYDRLLSDGKIVVNGIRFDVGQSSIKPESNGAINKIVKLMKKNSAVNLSIEGHTDSDGDKKANQTLSQARAEAVMARMIVLGIDANRLKSKGLGESKPLDSNNSAEGKANNRRVEFVKF